MSVQFITHRGVRVMVHDSSIPGHVAVHINGPDDARVFATLNEHGLWSGTIPGERDLYSPVKPIYCGEPLAHTRHQVTVEETDFTYTCDGLPSTHPQCGDETVHAGHWLGEHTHRWCGGVQS